MASDGAERSGLKAEDRRRTRIAVWGWALLVLLLVQNLLGIYLNLFVALPSTQDLGSLIAAYSVLALHVLVGFLILGTAAVIVFLSARSRRLALWLPAAAALALAFLAFSAGVEFTVGGQDDVLSFLMELAFLGLVAADVFVIYQASKAASLRTAAGDAAPTKE